MSTDSNAKPRRFAWWLVLAVLALGIVAAAWPIVERTNFVFDDYRYLNAIRKADAGEVDALVDAAIVENRWDGNWWVPDGTYIRFWRPIVVASYWFDSRLFGRNPEGFVLSNVLLHLVCSWLVFCVLRHVLARMGNERGDWPALAGALLFAVQSCHTEQLWYVAGRTDTQAAFFFLLGLVAWLRGARAWVLGIAFFVMLVAKEYTLLFGLVVLLVEWWLPRDGRRGLATLFSRERSRFVAMGMALAFFLVVRHVALGEAGAGAKPFPYVYMPDRAGFFERTTGVFLEYVMGVVWGRYLSPFTANLEQTVGQHAWWRLLVSSAAFLGFCGWALRHRAGRIGVASFCLLLLPMLPFYSTGRYLYLPTACLALAFVAVLARAPRRVAVAFAVVCIVTQAVTAQYWLGQFNLRPDGHTHPEYAAGLVIESHLDLSADAPPCFLLDYPALDAGGELNVLDWLTIQFLQDTVEVLVDHDVPDLHVISTAPLDPSEGVAIVERRGEGFALVRPRGPLVHHDPLFHLDHRRVKEGERWTESGYEFEVLRERGGTTTAAEVYPLADRWQLSLFSPRRTAPGWHTQGLP